MTKTTSPTPSMDSIHGTNSIASSFGEPNGYRTDSPLTVDGTSPPSDSLLNSTEGGFSSKPLAGFCGSSECSTSSGCSSNTNNTNNNSNSNNNNNHNIINVKACINGSGSSVSSVNVSGNGKSECITTDVTNVTTAAGNAAAPKDPGIIGSNLKRNIYSNAAMSATSQTALSSNKSPCRGKSTSPFGGATSSSAISISSSNGNGSSSSSSSGNCLVKPLTLKPVNDADNSTHCCSACKKIEVRLVAMCTMCNSYLCKNCVVGHKMANCYLMHKAAGAGGGAGTTSTATNVMTNGSCNSNSSSSGNAGSVRFGLSSMMESYEYHGNVSTLADYWPQMPTTTKHAPLQRNNSVNNDTTTNTSNTSSTTHPFSPQLSKIVFLAAAKNSAAAAAAGNTGNGNGNGNGNGGNGSGSGNGNNGVNRNSSNQQNQTNEHQSTTSSTPTSTSTLSSSSFFQNNHDQLLAPMHQSNGQHMFCSRHKHELLKYTCRTCCMPLCKDCALEHSNDAHDVDIQTSSSSSATATSSATSSATNGGGGGAGGNNSNDSNSTTPSSTIQLVVAQLRSKINEVIQYVGNIDGLANYYKQQYTNTLQQLNEVHEYLSATIDDVYRDLKLELESMYSAKAVAHSEIVRRSKDVVERAAQACENMERTSNMIATDVAQLASQLDQMSQQCTLDLQQKNEFQLTSNTEATNVLLSVRSVFGHLRLAMPQSNATYLDNASSYGLSKQPPIARPLQSLSNSSAASSSINCGVGSANNNGSNGYYYASNSYLVDNALNLGLTGANDGSGSGGGGCGYGNGRNSADIFLQRSAMNGNMNSNAAADTNNDYEELVLGQRFNPILSKATSAAAAAGNNGLILASYNVPSYEKWSSVTTPMDGIYGSGGGGGSSGGGGGNGNSAALETYGGGVGSNGIGGGGAGAEQILDMTRRMSVAALTYPPKSNIKRLKMSYHCKFGEFGVTDGQFTEPSGVAVNAQNDIIVADTNNHRIQVFHRDGRYKFHFGECGKRDNQLLYPNRVAVVRSTGDIIVTERSPTHQIQIYDQFGHFLRKFGANILQHPRGVTVDNKGRIIVVECKVMRVIIFDQLGNVVQKFGCSKHLEFPNGVVVNDHQEIFISDNRAHCVKVFNYEGVYLRQIGGEGLTNYPIGVGINTRGEILIADNHNNFNLTIFTQDGVLVSALESKVKHAQCFDVALMDDYSVVLASKDYRLYIYRYVPPMSTATSSVTAAAAAAAAAAMQPICM